MVSFIGYATTGAQYLRVQMPLFTIVTAISALVCYLLVPTQELIGAAIALIVDAIVQFIFSLGVIFYALYKLDKHPHPTEPNSID